MKLNSSTSMDRSLVDLIQSWPPRTKIWLLAVFCPTIGYLAGVVAASPVFWVRNPITATTWLVFVGPAVLSCAYGLSRNSWKASLLGLMPQMCVVAGICWANRATAHQLVAFWPIVFHAELGPGLGIWLAFASMAILNRRGDRRGQGA